MAGSTGAGYVHFNKVSGINGVYKGAAGSEVLISGREGVTDLSIAQATTAAVDTYMVAPYNASFSGYVVFSVSSGTGRVVTVNAGSAGAELGTTAVTGVTGTLGAVVALTGSANVTAGQALRINLASCATAQVQVGVVINWTKV